MTSLLIGFDSAWTATKRGAIISAVVHDDGSLTELGDPRAVSFAEAQSAIEEWRRIYNPQRTFVLLDQPTVVPNAGGQRPVENIISSPIGARRGAVQPANTGRIDMFGVAAPVWRFLSSLGCAADPLTQNAQLIVAETYPVLAMIALGWLLPDDRRCGRLPKYNPARRRTFKSSDWQYVCRRAAELTKEQGLSQTAAWLDSASRLTQPIKSLQDQLDACICLSVARKLSVGETLLLVGQKTSGYVIVPDAPFLRNELAARCRATQRAPHEWLTSYRHSIG